MSNARRTKRCLIAARQTKHTSMRHTTTLSSSAFDSARRQAKLQASYHRGRTDFAVRVGARMRALPWRWGVPATPRSAFSPTRAARRVGDLAAAWGAPDSARGLPPLDCSGRVAANLEDVCLGPAMPRCCSQRPGTPAVHGASPAAPGDPSRRRPASAHRNAPTTGCMPASRLLRTRPTAALFWHFASRARRVRYFMHELGSQ